MKETTCSQQQAILGRVVSGSLWRVGLSQGDRWEGALPQDAAWHAHRVEPGAAMRDRRPVRQELQRQTHDLVGGGLPEQESEFQVCSTFSRQSIRRPGVAMMTSQPLRSL